MNRIRFGVNCWWALAVVSTIALLACQRSAQQSAQQVSTGWRVEHAHMVELPPGQHRGAVYLVLHNEGAADRQILNLEASIAGHVEVHQHIHEDGLMKMRQVAHTPVPAKGQTTFASGGYHIMLFDVAEPPKVGSQFTLTLEFDGGEHLTFPVNVVSP